MNKSINDILYLDIFKKAWQITWKNRFLWWFGLLVSLTGSLNYRFNLPSDQEPAADITKEKAIDFITTNSYWLIPAIIFLFILMIVFMILSIIGRGALIKSLSQVLKNEPTNFRQGFQQGKKYFWKIVAINLIVGLLILLFIVVGLVPSIFLLANKAIAGGVLLLILTIIILIPLIIAASFSGSYAQIYAVLGEMRAIDSLEQGYNLFRKNILASIVMSLLFIPLGMLLLFGIIMLILVFVLVFGLIALMFYTLAGKIGAIIIGGIATVLFLACVLAISSVYQVFAQAAWLLFFEEIAKPKVEEEVKEEVKEPKTEVLPATDAVVKTIDGK